METNLHFDCTRCGGCCRGWRLPLSIAEATRWAAAGYRIDVLAQALPGQSGPCQPTWLDGFPAAIDGMAVRISIVLTVDLGSACPHLRADGCCAIHASRPLACRVYPAGLDPDRPTHPAHKRCPPQAWTGGSALLAADGTCVDGEYRRDRDQFHAALNADLDHMPRLCALIGLHQVGWLGHGCMIHRPPRRRLLAALRLTQLRPPARPVGNFDWVVVQGHDIPGITGSQYLPLGPG